METDLKENIDNANDILESFEDAIEHLDVLDDQLTSSDTKPKLNGVEIMTVSNSLSDSVHIAPKTSTMKKTATEGSIVSNSSDDNREGIEPSCAKPSNKPESPSIIEKTKVTNLEAITNDLASININKTNSELTKHSIVLCGVKLDQDELVSEVADTMDDKVKEIDKTEVTSNKELVEKTEETKASTELEDHSKVSKEAGSEVVSINRDQLPDILKEAQKKMKTSDILCVDTNVSDDIDVNAKKNIEKEESVHTDPNESIKEEGSVHTDPNESIKEEGSVPTDPNDSIEEEKSVHTDPNESIEEEGSVHMDPNDSNEKEKSFHTDPNESIEEEESDHTDPNDSIEKEERVHTDRIESIEEEKNDDNISKGDDCSIESEREQGDGQGEQEEVKKELALDEDRRNPEYIPRKGSFYEHDTRTLDGFDDEVKKIEEELAARRKKPKPISSESPWSHDKYNELDQMPKSTQEIIDTYGYDIRNEEHAPKARRNRRYGRGPNKYNRDWKDEDAYMKMENKPRTPGNRGGRSVNDRLKPQQNGDWEHHTREEFPALRAREESTQQLNSSQMDKLSDLDKYASPSLNYFDEIGMKAEKGAWVPPPPFSQKNVVNKELEKAKPSNVLPKELHGPRAGIDTMPEFKTNDTLGVSKVTPSTLRSFIESWPSRNEVEEIKPSNVLPKELQSATASIEEMPELKTYDIPKGRKLATTPLSDYMVTRTSTLPTPAHWFYSRGNTTGAPDPALSKLALSGMRGGKRYSVQRQKSLPVTLEIAPPPLTMETIVQDEPPEPTTGPSLQAPGYYHHGSTGTVPPISVPQLSPSHLVFSQSRPISNPPNPSPTMVIPSMSGDTPIFHSNSYQPSTGVHSDPNLNNRVPRAAPPMLVPVHFVQPTLSQVPRFTAQPSPTFNTQPQTGFTNQTQAGFTNQRQAAPMMSYRAQPIQFQPMQSTMVNMPPQPEVFQPAGGITYYSPQTQAVLHRPTLSKRVKSAIPIVPPSELQTPMPRLEDLIQEDPM